MCFEPPTKPQAFDDVGRIVGNDCFSSSNMYFSNERKEKLIKVERNDLFKWQNNDQCKFRNARMKVIYFLSSIFERFCCLLVLWKDW